jgi:hypothetical protein
MALKIRVQNSRVRNMHQISDTTGASNRLRQWPSYGEANPISQFTKSADCPLQPDKIEKP